MNITPKQKEFVKKNWKNTNSDNFAKQFNLEQEVVDNYINELKNNKNPKWFYFILLLIPIIFFILLETGLRVFNYGYDFRVFRPLSKDFPGLLVFNPDYPQKFFNNTDIVPSVIPDPFSEIKSKNSFRVFVLGGSTTAGFPFSYNASFARYIKRRLEILYPKIDIEVINMGISAVNSFTVKDLIPDIIKQKPNLVLIYAGHNEYYGSLGVGSTESISNSIWIVDLVLKLKEFKTYQLISNFIKTTKGTFSNENEKKGKTLMSQMVGEKLIELNSKLFNKGLEQFYVNMDEVLGSLNEAGIKTVISTLTCNLKQKPFESIGNTGNSANTDFAKAEDDFKVSNYINSQKSYILAKEKDALRFRAPEKINSIIKELALKYSVPVAKSDSLFSKNSEGEITGYNLIVDHLHPNVEGHQLIGDLFFNVMKKNSYLPYEPMKNISLEEQKTLAQNTLAYTRFDSTYASITLNYLLNSYPFVKDAEKQTKTYVLENYSDSLAEMTVKGSISWEQGHYMVAEKYYTKKNYKKFIDEVMTLIDDKPFVKSNYIFCADKLRYASKLDLSLQILLKMNKQFPNDDYSSKWLGTIALGRKYYERAIYYYEKILEHNKTDAQVYYNISGAYFYTKQLNKAKDALEKCLAISPDYPGAKEALKDLKRF